MSRFLAAIAFAIVTLAAPGEALAHGTAHHREHVGDEHGKALAAPADAPSISSVDHADEHPHPRLEAAALTRVDAMTFLVVLPLRVPAVRVSRVGEATPTRRAAMARGDRDTGPPPRLRAPPAR